MDAKTLDQLDGFQLRWKRQMHIEDSIKHFQPDCNEALEMLDALYAAHSRRYADAFPEVLAAFEELRAELDAADDRECA